MRPTSPYGPCANWRRIKAASAACEVVVSGPIRLNRSDQQTAVVTHVDASQLIFATNPWLPALQSSRHSCCGDSKGMRTAAAARIDDPCAKICLLGGFAAGLLDTGTGHNFGRGLFLVGFSALYRSL